MHSLMLLFASLCVDLEDFIRYTIVRQRACVVVDVVVNVVAVDVVVVDVVVVDVVVVDVGVVDVGGVAVGAWMWLL